MNKHFTKKSIEKIMLEYFDNPNLSRLSNIIEELSIDSLSMLEIITFIESTFNIRVTTNDLIIENWDTIDNIVNFIKDKLNETMPKL